MISWALILVQLQLSSFFSSYLACFMSFMEQVGWDRVEWENMRSDEEKLNRVG